MMAPYRNFCFSQHFDFTQNAASQKSSMITIIICFIVTTSGISFPTSVIHAKAGGNAVLSVSFNQGFQSPFIELCYLKEENNEHIMWIYDAKESQTKKCDPDFCKRAEFNVFISNRSIRIQIKRVKPTDGGMYRFTVLNGWISIVTVELQVSDTAEQDEKEDVKSHHRIYAASLTVFTAALVASLAIMICRKRDVVECTSMKIKESGSLSLHNICNSCL